MKKFPKGMLIIAVSILATLVVLPIAIASYTRETVFGGEKKEKSHELADTSSLVTRLRSSAEEKKKKQEQRSTEKRPIAEVLATAKARRSINPHASGMSNFDEKLSQDLLQHRVESISQRSSKIASWSLPVEPVKDDPAKVIAPSTSSEEFQRLAAYEHPHGLKEPRRGEIVYQGTLIEGELLTKIDTNSPGMVKAVITRNVYSRPSILLIPRGTQVIGEIGGNSLTYGDEKVAVAWNRLILPNKQSLVLDGMRAASPDGSGGVDGEVDNRWGLVLLSTAVSAALGSGVPAVTDSNYSDSYRQSYGQRVTQQAGTDVLNTGRSIVERELGVRPRIIVEKGQQIMLTVEKDMLLPQYR